MAHLTRHDLKHEDDFERMVRQTREIFAERGRQILTGVLLGIAVVAAAWAFRLHEQTQEEQAGFALSHALRVYHGFVKDPENPQNTPPDLTFSTEEEKYERALDEFSEVFAQYPGRKAGGFARTYMGLCQARLDRKEDALKTLEAAARNANPEVSTQAKFVLAREKAQAGQVEKAQEIYRKLIEEKTAASLHPVAQMALADTYRESNPEEARKLYRELQTRFPAQTALFTSLQSLLDFLPKPASPPPSDISPPAETSPEEQDAPSSSSQAGDSGAGTE